MTAAMQLAHWLAGVVVLAEALNKLERTAPCRHGLGWRERVTEWLKAIAWALLAVGGAGAAITPLISLEKPTLQDVCVIVGFAVLIVRTRVKEG
ncbi:hypothetical protein [Polaromonas jejuensis]|uniref:Uncharacterized protein n=1 Tax=Polaromonas jejuensis TaxID=457502 RepID=A0ABW0QMT4_9BURK|nr:hypothetical protein [Polaromonas jejuensis]